MHLQPRLLVASCIAQSCTGTIVDDFSHNVVSITTMAPAIAATALLTRNSLVLHGLLGHLKVGRRD